MVGKWRVVVPAALALVLVAASCYAAKVEIGQSGPQWSGLTGADDKSYSLSDFSDAKALVLVFTCNHCPVAKAYEDRLIALQKDYEGKGVRVIAVNSNSPDRSPGDSLENMKARAAGEDLGRWRKNKSAFNFPYLFDASQQVARDYGATCTPHVFVLGKDRKIAYMGNIDDNQNKPDEAAPNLRNALDSILAGQSPEPAVTKQFGCSIKWK